MTNPSDSTDRLLKRVIFSVVWFVILLFYISSLSSTNLVYLLFSLLLVLPIWFFADKDHKTTDISSMWKRLSNGWSKYKIRSIISGVLFLFFLIISLVSIIDNIYQNKQNIAQQEAYNNAPIPVIEILSKTGNIGNSTGYILVYKTHDTTEVVITASGVQSFSGNDKENSLSFSLEGVGKHTLNLSVVAKNEYKSSTKDITITRTKTAEEVKLETQEKERIENEQAQVGIDRLNGYINEMKEGYNFYDVATISTTVYRFVALWGLIQEDLENQNPKIVQKAKEAKTKLISTQKSIFPLLRKKRCDLSDQAMREYDIDVKCSGGTAKFIGGTFASNGNIKESYAAVSDMLYLLRFKKASFYWYEGSDYTYYNIDSPSDAELN